MQKVIILIFMICTLQELYAASENYDYDNYLKNLYSLNGKIVKTVIIDIEAKKLLKHLNIEFHKEGLPVDLKLLQDSVRTLFLSERFGELYILAEEIDKNYIKLIYKFKAMKRISKIIFSGNQNVTTWKLAENLLVRVGDTVDNNMILRSKQKIYDYYKSQGYMFANILYSVKSLDSERAVLVFTIVENKIQTVRQVLFNGGEFLQKEFYETVSLKKERPMALKNIETDREALEKTVRDNYFPFAKIGDPKIDESKRTIRWDIELGPKVQLIFRSLDPFNNDLFLGKAFDENDVRAYLNLSTYSIPENNTLNDDIFTNIKDSLENYWREKGFFSVKIKFEKKRDSVNMLDQVVFIIDSGDYYSYKLKFAGVKEEFVSELMEIVKNYSPKLQSNVFNLADIDASKVLIQSFYKSKGYLNSNFVEPFGFEYDHKKKSVIVNIEIAEGTQTQIFDIMFGSELESNLREVKEIMTLEKAMPLNIVELEKIISKIEELYREKGYYNAKVISDDLITYSSNGSMASVQIKLKLGELITIGNIIYQGNYITSSRIVQREIQSHSINITGGALYIPSHIMIAQEKLSATNVFQSVSIVSIPSLDDSSKMDLIVKVVEKDPGLVKFGMGYKNEKGVRVFGSLANNNVGGMNRTLYVNGELLQSLDKEIVEKDFNTEYSMKVGFIEPWLFNSRNLIFENLKLSGDCLWAREDTKAYLIKRKQDASVALDKKLSKWANVKLGYDYEYDTGYNKTYNTNFRSNFGTITPILEIDHRNNIFNPTKGAFNKIVLEYSDHQIFSDYDFYKLWANSNWYLQILKSTVFAVSLRGGTSKTYSNNELNEKSLPLIKRYFLGGRTSVRGYDQDMLGPQKDGKPLGGEQFVNYKFELREFMSNNLGLVLFLDGGNVYLKGYSYALKNSWGVGLRYNTPIGPISFEYGVKINPEANERKSAIHFSIGSF